jgi:hypothetical protein
VIWLAKHWILLVRATSGLVGKGLLLAIAELALLYLAIEPAYPSATSIFYAGFSIFSLALVLDYFFPGLAQALKALVLAQLIVFPVLIFNAIPTLSMTGDADLIASDSIFRTFAALALTAAGFVGSVSGPVLRNLVEEFYGQPAPSFKPPGNSALSSEILLEKYETLRFKLRTQPIGDGDRVELSSLEAEIARRGLMVKRFAQS